MPSKSASPAKPKPEAATSANTPAFTTDGFKVWQEIYAEGNRFMMDRWRQAMDAHAAMMKSTSRAEAMQIHGDYLQAAFKQYSEETTYLFNLAFEAANLPSITPNSSSKRKYNDVPV